jgi:hypothetical protein
MEKEKRIEPALKIDSGFKINVLCLEDDDISMEQKMSIALHIKESLERSKRILERNQNPHLGLSITPEEQAFINKFLPADEQLKVV